MSSTFYKTKKLLAILVACSCALPAFAAIGSITEQTGPVAEIARNKNKLEAKKGTGLESNDLISTTKTKLGLTFEDNTKVSVNEQSKLKIDDFIYDPNNKSAGKLAMKVALGTVRYASGNIAKDNNKAVDIRTPTATVAVRGTDFTMTVDETGRSLVILLPSCPENAKDEAECYTGEIMVSTDAGYVLLNQAFQATVVASANSAPTNPRLIDIDQKMIDNLLIISPPYELRSIAYLDQADRDYNPLDFDLLDFKDLMEDLLADDELGKFSKLDLNYLEQDFLDNFFNLMDSGLANDELAEKDGVFPNVTGYPWIQWAYNEETVFMRSERPPHIAEVNGTRSLNGTVNLVQDGITAAVQINGGSDVAINITQTQ